MERSTKYLVHCLNLSPSKKTHAFGKSERFSPCKSYGEFKYNVEEPKTKILTNFGFGEKDQFQKIFLNHNPSPNRYLIKSQFDIKSKGYSFGKSPTKIRKRENQQKKSHHQSTSCWMHQKSNHTQQNFNPETTTDQLKTKLMDKKPTNTKTSQPSDPYQRRSVTPTRKPLPGPGTYNRFSEFGPVNYYK